LDKPWLKLVELGHSVMLGTRNPAHLDDPKGRDPDARTLRNWLALAGPDASVGSFRNAAAYGELVINALSGAVSLDVLTAAAPTSLTANRD
jgi:hypothetical protein